MRAIDHWSVEGDADGYYIVNGYGQPMLPDNFLTRDAAERCLEKLLVADAAHRTRQAETRRAR